MTATVLRIAKLYCEIIEEIDAADLKAKGNPYQMHLEGIESLKQAYVNAESALDELDCVLCNAVRFGGLDWAKAARKSAISTFEL